jgi:hypothetical protein
LKKVDGAPERMRAELPFSLQAAVIVPRLPAQDMNNWPNETDNVPRERFNLFAQSRLL